MVHTANQVLISGAGPSGLVLALALRKNGLNVRIIDRELGPRLGERGPGVSARSLELHKILGTFPEIIATAGRLPTMREHDLKDPYKVVRTFELHPVNETNPNAPWRNYVAIGQNHHERILREHLETFGLTIEFGSELRNFTQFEDRVTVEIAKRDSTGKETLENANFSWLIGADGARSIVRKTLGLSFLGETRDDEESVLADLKIHSPQLKFWETWGTRESKLLFLRPSSQDHDIVSVVLMGKVDGSRLAKDPVALVDELHAVMGREDIEFGEVIWSSKYRPNIRMVDRLRVGRVFVVGDAAHCHTPAGGQGLNSSIQDSFNLAWKLALVHKGIARAHLLDTYGEERLPVIAQMLNKTTELEKYTLFESNGKAKHLSVETDIRRDMNQLGVNYRGSSVLYYEPSKEDPVFVKGTSYNRTSETEALPGDRAPEAPKLLQIGGNNITTSLFDIFSPSHHTALVFADHNTNGNALESVANALDTQPLGTVRAVLIFSARGQETVVDEYGFGPAYVDSEGHAFKGYCVRTQTGGIGHDVSPLVVIVRPDGVIGARFRGPEGVARYFTGIFNCPTSLPHN